MKIVRFVRDAAPYMVGDLAGFDDAAIERLGDAVVPFVAPTPEPEPEPVVVARRRAPAKS